MIHFFNFDDRFCGTVEKYRRVSIDPNEITCQACQDNDTLELTDQAKEYLATLST